jgi:glycine dehydrogenase subunit 1
VPGYAVATTAPFVKEFVVRCPVPAAEVNRALLRQGIVGGFDLGQVDSTLADCMLFCCTELTTRADIDRLVTTLTDLTQS